MNADEFSSIAERLMRCPATPYHEELVASECCKLASELGLACTQDSYGNLLLTLKTAELPPLVLAAHMDHPGFSHVRIMAPKTWSAHFRGRVGEEYFVSGLPLLLMPHRVQAFLGDRISGEEFTIFTEPEVGVGGTPTFAVWELADFCREGDKILGRSCDDLIGVAAIFAAMAELKRAGAPVHILAAITRAEEVGFHGALALAQSKSLPADSLIISLETSKEIPPVKMGGGVIVRVGDRASTFDSAATRFLVEAGAEISAADQNFHLQRALMSGGTCEATAYQEYGYRTAAVCIALGNYHNCGEGNQIEPEFVNIDDALGMVRLLAHSARNIHRFGELAGKLPQRLSGYAQEAIAALKKHPLSL
jgi:putative aminopeptidase FrvX